MNLTPYVRQLQELLPAPWRVEQLTASRSADRRDDGALRIAAPDGAVATLRVEVRDRLMARQALQTVDRLDAYNAPDTDGRIVFARYISPLARERLGAGGISFADSTGNVSLKVGRPAIFIRMQGASEDPDPPRRGVQSLKGPKAGRIVRGLCDFKPPLGVREFASRTSTSPSYVTRVLSLLEEDDLVVRNEKREIESVRWADLIRRWTMDYAVRDSNRVRQYLAPRGLANIMEELARCGEEYCVTGTFAVPPEAMVVPGTVLTCFTFSPEWLSAEIGLRPTTSGANVLVVEPFDGLVFERSRELNEVKMVALSQCAADLLTGPGREPAQGEALLDWMKEFEDEWRT